MEKLEETTGSTAWYDEELAMDGNERWRKRDKVGGGDCGEESHAEGLCPETECPPVPVAVSRREISSR